MSARRELRPAAPLRVPPNNLDAERSVLGALLLDNGQAQMVAGKLQPEDFYLDAHADLFRAMLGLRARSAPIDTLTLADELERQGSLMRVGGLEVLTSLAASVPTAANVEYYARMVADDSRKRQLIAAGGRLADLGFNESLEADAAVEEARRTVARAAGGLPLSRPLSEFSANELAAMTTEDFLMPWLPMLGMDGWFVEKWSHLIAAYPRTGKTELLIRLIREWLKRGHKVALLSEESMHLWALRLHGLGGDWDGLRVICGLGADPAELLARAFGGDEGIVVVDTLRNLLRLQDEKDNSEVARVINPWVAAAREADKTLVMAHHLKKGGGEHGEGITGGHALLGAFDIAIELRFDSPTHADRRILESHPRLVDRQEVVYEKRDLDFVILGAKDQVNRSDVDAEILEALPLDCADAVTAKKVSDTVPELSLRRAQDRLEALALGLVVARIGAGKRGDPYLYYRPTSEFHAEFHAELPLGAHETSDSISKFHAEGVAHETARNPSTTPAPEFHALGVPPTGENTPARMKRPYGGLPHGQHSSPADRNGRDKTVGLGGSADVAAAPDQPMPGGADGLAHAADQPAVTGSSPKRSRGTDPDQPDPRFEL